MKQTQSERAMTTEKKTSSAEIFSGKRKKSFLTFFVRMIAKRDSKFRRDFRPSGVRV